MITEEALFRVVLILFDNNFDFSAMSSKSNKWEAEKQRRLELSLEDRRKVSSF